MNPADLYFHIPDRPAPLTLADCGTSVAGKRYQIIDVYQQHVPPFTSSHADGLPNQVAAEVWLQHGDERRWLVLTGADGFTDDVFGWNCRDARDWVGHLVDVWVDAQIDVTGKVAGHVRVAAVPEL